MQTVDKLKSYQLVILFHHDTGMSKEKECTKGVCVPTPIHQP